MKNKITGTNRCPHFLSLTIDQRRALVMKRLLCFNCLRGGHSASGQKSHQNVDESEPSNSQPVSLNGAVYKSGPKSSFRENRIYILSTTLVRDCRGKFFAWRTLVDTASERSYITEDCIKRLGLPRISSKITLSCISSVNAESTLVH